MQSSTQYLAARIILSSGEVLDVVGKVSMQVSHGDLFGDDQRHMRWGGRREFELRIRSTDWVLYHSAQEAPEHNSKDHHRALTSGAPSLPGEIVEAEFVEED